MAYDAIDKGDYQQALALYEKAMLENPSDSLAEAGLAQVKLLIRLVGQDLQALASSDASTDEEIILKADALIATGMAEAGFKLLLGVFEKMAKDLREPLRLRLVELFLVVGNDRPEVIEARKSLSLLLF
jgi:putative thioredoxin